MLVRNSNTLISNIEKIKLSMERRNYAESTVRSYIKFLKMYAQFCAEREFDPREEAEPFIVHLIHRKYSISSQNQAINAIKYYWEHMLGMERVKIKIDRPKTPRKVPVVLSPKQVVKLFNSCNNPKHRLILKTIYALGLRRSELINLKIADIHADRNVVVIEQSKGRKDRICPIPKELLSELRDYYNVYKPYLYLFEGKDSTAEIPRPYSATSIQNILRYTVEKAKIRMKVTPHTLRHSYATHLYEHGVNLRSIQVLLGHNSSKTTEIYTHVTNQHILNTPSPLSFLNTDSE